METISLQKARWEFEHMSEIDDFFPDVTSLILNGEVDYDLTISVRFPFLYLFLFSFTFMVHGSQPFNGYEADWENRRS